MLRPQKNNGLPRNNQDRAWTVAYRLVMAADGLVSTADAFLDALHAMSDAPTDPPTAWRVSDAAHAEADVRHVGRLAEFLACQRNNPFIDHDACDVALWDLSDSVCRWSAAPGDGERLEAVRAAQAAFMRAVGAELGYPSSLSVFERARLRLHGGAWKLSWLVRKPFRRGV